MNLYDLDARAVDTVLDGRPEQRVMQQGDYAGLDSRSFGADGIGYAPRPSVSAMNHDLAGRVTHVDAMLKLLDYLPADEPPANLLERTMQHLGSATRRPARTATSVEAGTALGTSIPGAIAPSSTGLGQGVHHSPKAGGDEDIVPA